MKTTKLFFMAALALLMTACSSNDEELTQQPPKAEGIPFTATISMDNGATTRALTESGTSITATWAENDEVALIHNDVVDKVTVASVTGGVATITGSITGSPTDGDAVTVVYPYSAVDLTTKDVKADVLAAQDGTLTGTGGTSIAENYYVRKGTGTLKVDGTATLNGNVSLTNQVAIFKFTTQNASSTAISVNSLTVFIGTQQYVITPASATSTLYAALPAVTTAQTVVFSAEGSDSKNYFFAKDGVTFAASKYYQSPLTMTQGAHLAALTGAYTAQDGETLTGTLGTNVQVSIAHGATVTLKDVDINSSGAWTVGDYAGITCAGDAIINLSGTNSVHGISGTSPGIFVPEGKTLTINGPGSLRATGCENGSGIGGFNWTSNCGNIVINGGNITALGGNLAAAIGAACGKTCGNISITGGTVIATSNAPSDGVGIGSGNGSLCGNISITGGTVTATGKGNGAGIGTSWEGTCGTITIGNTGTMVIATRGNDWANSIGAGNGSTYCGTVTIGGTVYWDGSAYQNDGGTYLKTNPLIYIAP